MKASKYENGLTVKQLKEAIKDWPEEDDNGEPTEVWMETGDNLSSPVRAIWPLNYRKNEDGKEWADIEFEPSA